MAFVLADRVWETTTSTGVGSVTLNGPRETNLVSFQNGIGVGNETYYYIIWDTGFEFGLGALTASTTFARTTPLGNHLGTATHVSLPTGQKDVFCSPPASRLILADREMIRLAPVKMRTQQLYLGDTDASWIVSGVVNQVSVFAGGAELVQLNGGSVRQATLLSTLSGTTEGPELDLYRNNPTPVVNAAIGVVRFSALNNASPTKQKFTAAKIRPKVLNVTPSSEAAELNIEVMIGGILTPLMRFDPNGIIVNDYAVTSGVSRPFFTGKSATSHNTAGLELWGNGFLVCTVDNQVAAVFNRKNTDGVVISVRKDNTEIGGASIAGTVVTWNTFTGGHWAEWDDKETEPDERPGTVVCATDQPYSEDRPDLPRIRVSRHRSDEAVYGVIASRQKSAPADVVTGSAPEDGTDRLIVNGLGTGMVRCVGPVRQGQLLETGSVPGCAHAVPRRNVTAATLGKARRTDLSHHERLVPVTLMCG